MAPSVTLCTQQHSVLQKYFHAFSIQLITGNDNAQHWSNQKIWDNILQGHQVIVCTHAILADALSNGFVKIEKIGLIIFDEGGWYSFSYQPY
jgi:RecG-like helicase